MAIDPHVHCRDGMEAYKETIKHVFEVASEQGVERIFDMPNTDPPILREADVRERLKLVPKSQQGNYFLYVGVTSDERQLEEAVRCYEEYDEVIGLKLFAGKSVGRLTVANIDEQKKIYTLLSDLGYMGVLAVHCEKESLIKQELWNPSDPITHSYTRPEEAEVESIKDQIQLVKETSFEGNLHICHISSPKSIELIDRERGTTRISCGVTPHHILWDDKVSARPDGLIYKVNPPLRSMTSVEELRRCLKDGKIDWIETDHAPHAVGEKLFPPHLSGYPSLYLYKQFVEQFLPSIGLKKQQIEKLTSGNIRRVFRNKLK